MRNLFAAIGTGNMPALTALNIDFSRVDNEALQTLARVINDGHLAHLTTFNAYVNARELIHEGSRTLATAIGTHLSNLKHLNIRIIDDNGAAIIADAMRQGRLQELTTLQLHGPISDVGAKAIVEALESGRCQALTTLDLKPR
jgi:hypothetical protein